MAAVLGSNRRKSYHKYACSSDETCCLRDDAGAGRRKEVPEAVAFVRHLESDMAANTAAPGSSGTGEDTVGVLVAVVEEAVDVIEGKAAEVEKHDKVELDTETAQNETVVPRMIVVHDRAM
jgi:hypothetical protein